MTTTPTTWIAVADSTRAKIFTPAEKGQALEQVQELHHAGSRTHERELITDRPGRTFDSNGPGRHALSESVSPREHEAWKLCKELADEIESARAQGKFDRLFLVAGPSLLGELKKRLSEPTARLVVSTLDKNLAQLNEQELIQHLPPEALQQEKDS
jgi:protein required for attachment to host cells